MRKIVSPNVELLREWFNYEPEIGRLTWKKTPRGRVPVGRIAGTFREKSRYRYVYFQGRNYAEHRLIWAICTGSAPEGEIDHINGVRDDNRIANLRDVSSNVNMQNIRHARKGNYSGLLGAHKSKEKFISSIWVGEECTYLGRFETAEEAHAAYIKAKRQLHEGCTI